MTLETFSDNSKTATPTPERFQPQVGQKGTGLDAIHPAGFESPTNKVEQESFLQATLGDAQRLFGSGSADKTNGSFRVADNNLTAFDFGSFDSIYPPNKSPERRAGNNRDGAGGNDRNLALAEDFRLTGRRDAGQLPEARRDGAEPPKGRGSEHLVGGKTISDGTTAGDSPVHAVVNQQRAHVIAGGDNTSNGPQVDANRKLHTTDLHDGQWDGHIENGKGEITNTQTGLTIKYDGQHYLATDKAGHTLAESDSLHRLDMDLHRLHVHITDAGAGTAATAEQQQLIAQGSTDTHAFQNSKTGNWHVVNSDMTLKTNNEQHYVDVRSRGGDQIRVRQNNGKNEIVSVGADGTEQPLTPAQIQSLKQSNIDVNPDTGAVSVRGRTIIDDKGNVHPTDDSHINVQDGQLKAHDQQGAEVRVSNDQQGGTSVAGQQFNWQSNNGFQGTDGSSIQTNPGGFTVTDANNFQTNLGFDGSFNINDPSGFNAFSMDSNWNSTFTDGSTLSDTGQYYAPDGSSGSYDTGYNSGDYYDQQQAYVAATDATTSADSDASAAITTAVADATNAQPDAGAPLDAAQGELLSALAKAEQAHDASAVGRILGEMGAVENTKGSVQPKEVAARMLRNQSDITSPYFLSQIDLTGSTVQGAVRRIQQEANPGTAVA